MDKAKLLADRGVGTEEVKLPNGLGVIVVRGLSREEVMRMRADVGPEAAVSEYEVNILACGLVDPRLTREEAAQWRKVANAVEVGLAVDAISRLSGLELGADKAAFKSVS